MALHSLPSDMRLYRLLFLLSLLLPLQAVAQNLPIPALPFLEIPASPGINAIGGAGVAAQTPDPHAFLYNPAQLGIAALETQAAGTLYPAGSIEWLSVGDLSIGSTALQAGVDLRSNNIPLTVGIGLAQTALRFGDRVFVGEDGNALATYEPQDRYRALSLGAATTGAVRIGLGGTFRHITTTDQATYADNSLDVTRLSGVSFDMGVLVNADVTRLLGVSSADMFYPDLKVSIGYSQTNIGREIFYTGSPKASPMPRTARIGWSLSAGFDIPLQSNRLRLLQTDVSLQSEHLLVRQGPEGEYSYRRFLGDMNLFENGLLGRSSEIVTARNGIRFTLAETISFSRGHFDGWGFDNVSTRGTDIHLAGLLKIIGTLAGQDSLRMFAESYDVRFTRSTYFKGGPNESSFSGVTFLVRR